MNLQLKSQHGLLSSSSALSSLAARTLPCGRRMLQQQLQQPGRRQPQAMLFRGSSPDNSISAHNLPLSQQTLDAAFRMLDDDRDGKLTRTQAARLLAYYLASQQHRPHPSRRRPLTWDQHLRASVSAASRLAGGSWLGLAAATGSFVRAKVAGGLQAHPPRASDIVWGAAGMAVAFAALGALAAVAKTLPVVGPAHAAGAPLLLGSFGTLAILLFGKPEAEPVRLWPIVAGQLGAAAIAMAVLQLCGTSLVARAAAMAATVAWQMHADAIHPPGGALVLMAMDNSAIQATLGWAWTLYPSLALSLGLLLPLSAATNWLRRTVQFDAPWDTPGAGAATLRQKTAAFAAQQAAKQVAVLRQYRALELDRGNDAQQLPHVQLRAQTSPLARLLRPLLQLLHAPPSQQEQQEQSWRPVTRRLPDGWGEDNTGGLRPSGSRRTSRDPPAPLPRSLRGFDSIDSADDAGSDPAGDSSSRDDDISRLTRMFDLGRSGVQEASAAEAAAAAALDAAIRRRLAAEEERQQLEAERALEDREHRRAIWGGASGSDGGGAEAGQQQQNSSLRRFRDKVDRMHAERLGLPPPAQQQKQQEKQRRPEQQKRPAPQQPQQARNQQQPQQQARAQQLPPQQPPLSQQHPAQQAPRPGSSSSSGATGGSGAAVRPGPRQRLERHWTLAADLQAGAQGAAPPRNNMLTLDEE